jgi:uncharacterized protein (TIGR02246 family)
MSAVTSVQPKVDTTDLPVPPRRRRRIKRTLGVTALTLGLAAGGAYLWLDSTAQVHNIGKTACEQVTPTGADTAAHQEICGVLSVMTDTWNRGDADAYGAIFTDDATYTTFVGTHYQGRRDITEAHRTLFSGFLKGTKLSDSFLGIRFYGPGTAVVTSRGDTYDGEPKEPGELSKIQTYTLVRQHDGTWRIAAFHNTQRQSAMERISFLFSPGTKPEAEK